MKNGFKTGGGFLSLAIALSKMLFFIFLNTAIPSRSVRCICAEKKVNLPHCDISLLELAPERDGVYSTSAHATKKKKLTMCARRQKLFPSSSLRCRPFKMSLAHKLLSKVEEEEIKYLQKYFAAFSPLEFLCKVFP
jgi:hypothetical protein